MKFIHLIALVLTSIEALIIIVIFWLVYPYNVVYVKSSTILNKIVHPGDRLMQQVVYCKYLPLKAIITKQIIDHITLGVTTNHGQPEIGNAKTGCHTTINEDVVIPSFLGQEMQVTISTTYEYHPNPFRSILVTFQTKPFNIVK